MAGRAGERVLERGLWWEKRGNTIWVSCGACGAWFHVSRQLLSASAAGGARLHCPGCHAEFLSCDAAAVVRPAGG